MSCLLKIKFMPNLDTHIDVLKSNYDTLKYLSNNNPHSLGWCITIIHYMALHYIQGYLAQKYNEHPDSHIILREKIKNDSNLKPIVYKYLDLENDSRAARYRGKKFNVYNMRSENLVWFRDIQDHILKLLKLPDHEKYNLHTLFN